MNQISGAIRCARYAFAPNFYHYCGPDTNGVFDDYVKETVGDKKLVEYLAKFETLYPYFITISQANNIRDPFDAKVVEAYWVGNELLNRVNQQQTYLSLQDGQNLKRRLKIKDYQELISKIDFKPKLHHSFHVFNVFTRTGHRMVAETVDTIDQCRIGWGVVTKIEEGRVWVNSQQLVIKGNKVVFRPKVKKLSQVIIELTLKRGDIVSYHWGVVCEKLTKIQMDWLEKMTMFHLQLFNRGD